MNEYQVTTPDDSVYVTRNHSAVRTTNFIYSQLIPYIGNKRKLLDLISRAIAHTDIGSETPTFLELFSGSGVVARLAKTLGFRVLANDWEPYSEAINGCCIRCNQPPAFASLGGYGAALQTLNHLPPTAGWVTDHLCPRDDANFDVEVDRMFFMRKNGMRIDSIREQIAEWQTAGVVDMDEMNCLLAPLVYQTCYASNTSGVFKGFHNGWGGKTGTALYRIKGDLALKPAVFHDNDLSNEVFREDAQTLALSLGDREVSIAYLDPPYNQHPYGSNYHVLNSVVMWDKPTLSQSISTGAKSAIRTDWRTERRSAYNHAKTASDAYRRLVSTLNARYILTSYSTDGLIPLAELLSVNVDRGNVQVEMKAYKRYRVSSQRYSNKPLNVEFIVVLDTHQKATQSADDLQESILATEAAVLRGHGG